MTDRFEGGNSMANEQTQAICRSVFKDNEETTLKTRFTQKWIEIINRAEKNKGVIAVQQ